MKVKDCAVQIRGVSYKPTDLHSKLNDNSVTLFRANNIKDGEIIFDDVLYVDKKCVSDEQYLKKGDILICASSGSKALVGKAAQIDFNGEYTFGAFCKAVRPNKNDDAILGVFFQSHAYRRMISALSQGVNINNIRNEHIDNLELPFFTAEVKQKFINQIQIVTKSIACCQHLLQKLDTLVKSRFIEMFGDLRINPHKWEMQNFETLTELITDGEHATPRRVEQGIYLLSARNVLNHSIQFDNVDYIDEDEYNRIARRITPRVGDVLISCSGSVGRCCCVPAGLKFQMVRSVALLRFKPFINPIFAEYMITSDYLQEQINSSKTASSQANLFQGKIATLQGVVPPIALQNQFAAFVQQVGKSKSVLQKLLEKQKLLRAALMQEYFG